MSDIVAGRVREARKGRGWQTADLAARCAEAGHPELSPNVIENIESGRRDKTGRRRRAVTVDELRVLADVLGFSPADILDGLPPGTLGGMSVDQLDAIGKLMQAAASFMRWRSGEGAEEEDTTSSTPVVLAIVTSSKGVLITRRRDGKPPWGFVAGEVRKDPGERPEDAAVREVKEETGLEVRPGEVIGERDHPATGRHMIYIAARPVRGTKVVVGDEEELAEVRWASLAEAGELMPDMFGSVREYLANQLGGR